MSAVLALKKVMPVSHEVSVDYDLSYSDQLEASGLDIPDGQRELICQPPHRHLYRPLFRGKSVRRFSFMPAYSYTSHREVLAGVSQCGRRLPMATETLSFAEQVGKDCWPPASLLAYGSLYIGPKGILHILRIGLKAVDGQETSYVELVPWEGVHKSSDLLLVISDEVIEKKIVPV